MERLTETSAVVEVSLEDREESEGLEEQQGELALNTTMDATRLIYLIKQLEKRKDFFELQDRESRYFYAEKKRKCEERIAFLKQTLLTYLQQNGLKNLSTPEGTAYQKTITVRTYPADDVLIRWALANVPNAVRVKHEPDKRAIVEYIRCTGEVPEGYSEAEETRVYIK